LPRSIANTIVEILKKHPYSFYVGTDSILIIFYTVKTRTNLTYPETFGIDRVYNFYLNVEPEVRLGIWSVLQILNVIMIIIDFIFRHFRSPLINDETFTDDEDYFEKHLASTSSNIPIIIYLHGNAFDRYVNSYLYIFK
jgi:hypothetical protein